MKRRSRSRQVITSQPDWWDDECLQTKRAQFNYLRRVRASNLQSDLELYTSHKRQFKSMFTMKERNLEKQRRRELQS